MILGNFLWAKKIIENRKKISEEFFFELTKRKKCKKVYLKRPV